VSHFSDDRRIAGEFIGTALLLSTVVGSGIMAEALAGGNVAIALLGNTIPTGAILVVLINLLGPVSGAHFNPAVTGVFAWRGELPARLAALYVLAQIAGGIAGVVIAHAMFDLPLVQLSAKMRSSSGQSFSEFVATFGLVFVILGSLHRQADTVPLMVGLYITAAYWFTASTSFANPAVTIARCLTNSFAGIAAADAPAFIVAQLAGAVAGVLVANWIFKRERAKS
jgi:glycerol uptake facilitator-like aquaporin